MAQFELGQKVRYTHRLLRQGDAPYHKSWLPIPTFTKEPLEGIIVGLRTLQNGISQYDWTAEQQLFTPDSYVTAYMVVSDLRRKPVFVLPEHIEEVLDEESSNGSTI